MVYMNIIDLNFKNYLKKMDTLFTFPLKNPKYNTIKELQKTCLYLEIPYHKKPELINTINSYYEKYGNLRLPYRIQINFQNQYYYVNRSHTFKSFIKTYDDVYREVYKLTSVDGKLSYIVRYCKIDKKWEFETNFKVQKNSITYLIIPKEELNKLRNISLYLEVSKIRRWQ